MPADWARVNELFHRALERRVPEREPFLRAECAGDDALRHEVASLLEASERAGDFMEAPAVRALPAHEPGGGPAPVAQGSLIGHYRVSRVLGEGGMGVVYLAEDTRLGRLVALKAVAPAHAGHETARHRLMQEARTTAGLRHPGIATVYALEELDGQCYIASEYIPGETLREELRRGPLSPAQVLDTGLQLARALQRAHELGIVHRDLKPENVMRTPAGEIKILDFGLARYREASARPLGDVAALAGTPAYMSPEQIRGDVVGPRSDIFSLGVILYELLSGTRPFAGSTSAPTRAHMLDEEPVPLALGGDRIAVRLGSIIGTCLQQAPDARFATTSDLIAALERVHAEEVGSSVGKATRQSATALRPARWWWTFHQLTASVVYLALLLPLWGAHRIAGQQATLALFFAGVGAMAVASTLRLNLVFAAQSLPSHADGQRQLARRWILAADLAFAVTLLGGCIAAIGSHALLAVLLLVAAIATSLAALVIEPATTRAAFDAQ